MYECIYVSVCMDVLLYMYVCMYVGMYVCVFVCMYCVFLQAGTGRRPVDWCRKYVSVLYACVHEWWKDGLADRCLLVSMIDCMCLCLTVFLGVYVSVCSLESFSCPRLL